MKTLIKNATLLDMVGDEPNIKKTDILIEENKIAKIEEEMSENSSSYSKLEEFIYKLSENNLVNLKFIRK